MKTIVQETFELNTEGIDALSLRIEQTVSQYTYLSKRDMLRVQIGAEEMLLHWMDKAADLQVQLTIRERGRWLDVSLSLHGIHYPCDPMGDTGGGLADNLLATLGIGWIYQFDRGQNSVYISLEVKPNHRVQQVFLAMILGVLTAVILRLMPDGAAETVRAYTIQPLFGIGSHFLTAVVSPMMLLAVMDGVLSAGSPRNLDRVGRYACTRYLVSTVFVIVCAGVVCAVFFPFHTGMGSENGIAAFLAFLTDIVPDNVISPFITCNITQIIFLGFVLGVAMLFLQRQVQNTKQLVNEANLIVCRVLSGFETILPAFIYLSMTDAGLSADITSLMSYMKMAGLFVAFLLIVTAVYMAAAAYRSAFSMRELLHLLKPSIVVQLASASSSVAFTEAYEACERGFGIDKKLVGFALPIGTVIHKPLIAAEFVFFIAAAKGASGEGLNIGTLCILMILAFLLSVAYPPVSGGEITCYTMLLMQMGLDGGMLAFACTLSSLFDTLEAPANTVCTELQLLLTAQKHQLMKQKTKTYHRS